MIYYLIVFLIVITLSYLLGNFYINNYFKNEIDNINKNDFTKTSLSISLGIIILYAVTAVAFTFFKTLYVWPLIILLIPIFKKKKVRSKSTISNINWKKILLIFSIACIVFTFHLVIFYNLQKRPFYDYIFLGKVSSGLLKYHTENLYNSYGLFHVSYKQNLYHYPELWLTGLLSLISNLSEVKILLFVTYPLLNFATLLTSIAIFSSFTNNKKIFILGGFGLLYGTKIFLPISGEFWELVQCYRGAPIASGNKLLVIYFISFSAILLYINKLEKYSYFLFSIIPICYPTTIPAFASIAVGLSLFHFSKNKLFNVTFHPSWIILVSIFFIIIFKNIFPFEATTKFEVATFPIKTHIIVFFETIFKIFIEHFVIFIAFIYVLITTKLKILNKQLVLFSFFGILGSILFVQLQSKNVPDINQVINNFSPVLITILFIEILRDIDRKRINLLVIITSFLALYNAVYSIAIKEKVTENRNLVQSDSFVSNVISELENNYPNNIVCSITKEQPLRWYYDSNNPFDFVSTSGKINPPLGIGTLFYGNMESYNNNYLNKDYPPFSHFNKNKLSYFEILSYLRVKYVKYLLVENYKSISYVFLKHFQLIYLDQKSKCSLWKFVL